LNNAILIAIGIGVSITLLVVLLSSFSLVQTTPRSEIRSNLDPELLKLPNANLTDDQLIAKTRDLKEIKAFLSKYPDAKSGGVTRMYEIKSDARNIGVGYTVQRNIAYANGTSELRELSVGVGFDRYSNKTLDVEFNCDTYLGGSATYLQGGIATVEGIEKGLCFG